MRYHALATDYDGTIAKHGQVDGNTVLALRRLKEAGRQLILVTGRELGDLFSVFPHPEMFDRIVAENGALLYNPATKNERVLAEAPPASLVNLLRERGVSPLSVGRVIVASFEPHDGVILETIRDLGLELQVIFNKGAVMILPSGVNKATGLKPALSELGLSARNVVGVGDAENDHAFLEYCECAAAVANALPTLKGRADIVTVHSHGAGVAELIGQMITDDLRSIESRLTRHEILLGLGDGGQEIRMKTFGANLLVAGNSGGGKSTLVSGLLEEMFEREYQACIIDTEGDYNALDKAVVFGDANNAPGVEAVLKALEQPQTNVVASLIGVQPADRPALIQRLLPALTAMRAGTGRPHWIMIDEAHHALPASLEPSARVLPAEMTNFVFVTARPKHLAPSVLTAANLVIAAGKSPADTIHHFCAATGREAPCLPPVTLQDREMLGWRSPETALFRFRGVEPKSTRWRQMRQQADLPVEKSFYFLGPEKKLHLRAQNPEMFLQLADGVDEQTWRHHLHAGEYSAWFRTQLNDVELADAIAEVERNRQLTAEESRAQVRARIEERYAVAV